MCAYYFQGASHDLPGERESFDIFFSNPDEDRGEQVLTGDHIIK